MTQTSTDVKVVNTNTTSTDDDQAAMRITLVMSSPMKEGKHESVILGDDEVEDHKNGNVGGQIDKVQNLTNQVVFERKSTNLDAAVFPSTIIESESFPSACHSTTSLDESCIS
jgi:hypothetical protein